MAVIVKPKRKASLRDYLYEYAIGLFSEKYPDPDRKFEFFHESFYDVYYGKNDSKFPLPKHTKRLFTIPANENNSIIICTAGENYLEFIVAFLDKWSTYSGIDVVVSFEEPEQVSLEGN